MYGVFDWRDPQVPYRGEAAAAYAQGSSRFFEERAGAAGTDFAAFACPLRRRSPPPWMGASPPSASYQKRTHSFLRRKPDMLARSSGQKTQCAATVTIA